MSGVLHPVGPEPRERYWVRRLAVLVAVVVAIGIVVALVGNAMSAGSAVQAEPALPTSLPPAAPATPTPTPTTLASPSATPTATPSAAATPSSTATASTSATPSSDKKADHGSAEKKVTDTKAAEKKAAEKKAAEKKAAEKKAAEKKAAETKARSQAPVSCAADQLRPAVTGPATVEASSSATFALSLVNGSAQACRVKVSASTFTLTVISGRDRIWSTDDCPAAVPGQSPRVGAEKSLAWKVTWNGKRSAAGCAKRPETPRPGYYWAVAQLDGAREVRWRFRLT